MRLITKLWATLLLLCVAGVANAAKTYEVDQKFTSVADLDGKAFAIVHEADSMAVYGSGAQNLGYGKITAAVTGTGNSGYYFKLEASSVEGAYLLRLQTPAGEPYSVWGSPGYLNSGADGGFDGCFILGLNNQNGQDVENGAVWEIEYVADKGFAFKNKARGGYFAGPSPAPTGTEPIYWTLCTLKEGEEAPDPEPEVIPEPEAPLAEGELIPDFFSITNEGGIPYGYEVKFGNEDRLYPTTYTGGARMFAFAEGGDFTRGIYFREGYIQYGNVKTLALEGGKKYIVYFNSAMWKDSGTTMEFTITKEGDETALLDSVINNTPNVNGSKDAVTGSTRSEIEFTPEADGNYILKWDAEGWKEVLLANVGVKVAPAVTPTPTDEPTIIDWVAGDQNYTNQLDLNGVEIALDAKTTMTCAKGTGSTTPKYYTTGSAVRTYGGNTITFKGEGITKIIITGVNGKVAELTASTGELTKDGIITTWKGEANEIVLTNSTSDQQHIAKLHVVYGGVEADIEPVHIANTAETAYTVAKAIELIDAGDALDETVFVKGIVSQVDGFNETYKSITYWISEDGTTEGQQFECYSGKGIAGADFASIDDVKVGATVVVKGTMAKYGQIYEFTKNNELVSYEAKPEQSWTAPNIAGEDPVTDGQYKVMNVGSGKYLAMGKAWFGWSTTAIVAEDGFVAKFAGDAASFTLTNTGNGKYVFTSGDDIQGDAMHADGANATNYGLTKLANGNYRIHDAGGNEESPCWGYNSDFHAAGIVAHADAAAEGWNCEWIFVGDNAANLYNAKKALYDALVYAKANGVDTDEASAVYNNNEATIDDLKAAAEKLTHATNFAVNTANAVEGADMTYTIVNPSFETGNTKGWTYEASNDHGAKENSNGTYTMTNCDGKYLFNIWSSGNQISQTIEDLPNGTYKMTAVIATDGGQKVQLNANGKSVQIDAVDKGTGVEGELEFDVLDNKATIGAEGVNKYWYKVDNFRLTFVKGINLDELVATYETTLANAKAVEGNMNAEVKTALDAAIEANSNVDKTDFNALTAAVNALTEATNVATASVAAYAKATEVLPKMKQLVDATNVYTAEALDNYYSKWVVKLDTKTLTSEEANALQDPFIITGWHASITCDNFLLSAWDTNADFQNARYYINTWSNEGNNDGSEFKVPFFEYWTNDDKSLGKDSLTATMSNLEAGEYDVTAWVRVRAKNGYTAPAYGITFQANDGEAVNAADGAQVGESQFYLKEVTATGTVAEDGVLKIKFNVAEDNNISWLSFKNVQFAKKQAEEVAHTWNFTKWSEATVANLKAEAAKGYTDGLWSDAEKADGSASTMEISKDNCFWQVGTSAAEGEELTANGQPIAELQGLLFKNNKARSLAIAVNYGDCTPANGEGFGPYNGPAYLWLGSKTVEYFTIKNVKAGTEIKMGVESHKITDARGVQLLINGTAIEGPDAPKEYTEQTWQIPGEGLVDVVVKNTNGCHLYFIDAEIGEPAPVDSALIAAIDALKAVIAADKTIQTDGQQGADALATAIATAEGAANAADATVESIAAARAALAAAVATFTKANIGADFAEIAQNQGKDISDGATRASVVEGEGYTQYTTDGGVCVIIKKYDVDVKNCDYVTVKFAEPLPNGICAAFWAQSGTANVGMPAGAYEYKYVFADDAQCAIANGIMPQLTLLTLWNSQTVKVVGVYKHYTEDYMTSINAVKTQMENGAIYNLNGQKVNKAQKGLYIINGKRVVVK